MKVAVVVLSVVMTLLFNSVVSAAGQYKILVTELDENRFSVALKNSYSDYYDQSIGGVFASRTIAEQAGKIALDLHLNPDADDAPDPCLHDINWM